MDKKNLINYSKLKNMKREAIIINTARGGIVNEKDLDKAKEYFEEIEKLLKKGSNFLKK